MSFALFDLFARLRDQQIIFCFSGPASQGVVEGIGEVLKQKMERDAAGAEIVRRVFSVFVEQMQNVINYSADRVTGPPEKEGEIRVGLVVVGREGDHFFVMTGNVMDQTDARSLAAQIRLLQAMDKERMKQHFKEQRRKEAPAGSKGAGLGLIETARRASGPLEFDLQETEAGRAFFTLKVTI
jgi:hypothetical protein